jgi:hypothetical protein
LLYGPSFHLCREPQKSPLAVAVDIVCDFGHNGLCNDNFVMLLKESPPATLMSTDAGICVKQQ